MFHYGLTSNSTQFSGPFRQKPTELGGYGLTAAPVQVVLGRVPLALTVLVLAVPEGLWWNRHPKLVNIERRNADLVICGPCFEYNTVINLEACRAPLRQREWFETVLVASATVICARTFCALAALNAAGLKEA
jgi:hypothetical protein